MISVEKNTPRWSRAEEDTAVNLYREGVLASDIADTINRIYRHGRSTVAIRRHMQALNVSWAENVDPDDRLPYAASTATLRARGHRGARLRYEASDAASERRQPWHPLLDPLPNWLTHHRKEIIA